MIVKKRVLTNISIRLKIKNYGKYLSQRVTNFSGGLFMFLSREVFSPSHVCAEMNVTKVKSVFTPLQVLHFFYYLPYH